MTHNPVYLIAAIVCFAAGICLFVWALIGAKKDGGFSITVTRRSINPVRGEKEGEG